MDDIRPHNRRGSESFVWPVLLIGAGIIFLLINLNVLPINAWAIIARFWPLVLILAGIDLLIGRRSRLAAVLMGLFTLILVAGVILFLLLAPRLPGLNALTRPDIMQTQTLETPLGQTTTARVQIDWSSGENSLASLPAGSPNLLEGQVETYGRLIYEADTDSPQANIRLDQEAQTANFFLFGQPALHWDILLNPQVRYDLRLGSGSGQVEVDLSELDLSSLNFNIGSGRLDLQLPPGDYRAGIDLGSGEVTIDLPAEVGVQVELEKGSGSFNPDPALELIEGDRDDDGVWETAGFDQAEQQVILSIDMGSGSLRINLP